MQMLQQTLRNNSGNDIGTSNPYSSVNSFNFACTSFHFASHVSVVSHTDIDWITDTEATYHVTPYKHLLHDPRPL